MRRDAANDIDLVEAAKTLWRAKWLIFWVTTAAAAVAIGYSLMATEWYRADVLLAPAAPPSAPALTGQLGSLASLAGINVDEGRTREAIAILESRDFIKSFIEEENLVAILLTNNSASVAEKEKGSEVPQPDIRDAVDYFRDKIQDVIEDEETGLVTLRIDWIDPNVAAVWADTLVSRLNNYMRARALQEAERNLEFLREALASAHVVTLQQSISSLLERELQRLMLAKGNEEFAFRVIDSAAVPKNRIRPKRTLTVLLSAFIGGMIAVLGVFFRESFREGRTS